MLESNCGIACSDLLTSHKPICTRDKNTFPCYALPRRNLRCFTVYVASLLKDFEKSVTIADLQ